jgi:hypothetical protein
MSVHLGASGLELRALPDGYKMGRKAFHVSTSGQQKRR